MKDKHNLTKSEIFRHYNKARAFARKNPHILDPKRVNGALGILQSSGDYFDSKDYNPRIDNCACPDSRYRKATCKHSIALMILARILQEREAHNVTELVTMTRVPLGVSL